MSEFITEYTHVDGTRWCGPTFTASSQEAAEALAMEYPMQPLKVLGRLERTIYVDEAGSECLPEEAKDVLRRYIAGKPSGRLQ